MDETEVGRMIDIVYKSLQNNKAVFWEEIARDGAQAKTLLTADERISVIQKHCEIFGHSSKDHLVYAVGFPSVGEEEFLAIKKVAEETEGCSLVTHGRMTRSDVDKAISAIHHAQLPRISFFFPTSEQMCGSLLKKTPQEVLTQSLEVLKYAKDNAGEIPIDIALADAARTDFSFLSDTLYQLNEEGIDIVKLCDSIGQLFPEEANQLFAHAMQNKPTSMQLGCHMHNDLGFAQANNISALRHGIRLVASSWLGLAERNGLQPTEQLLFMLGHQDTNALKRLRINHLEPIFNQALDLSFLPVVGKMVSNFTNVPLTMTHGIIGPGVNSLSTGTPFIHRRTFQPFDPESALGIEAEIHITHLASKKLIEEVANANGYTDLDESILEELFVYVKTKPYHSNSPIIPFSDLKTIIERKPMPNES